MELRRAFQVVVVMAALSGCALAQIRSRAGSVVLSATLSDGLTIAVNAGNVVNFALAPNTAINAGSTTTTIRTAWSLKPGNGRQIAVWAYFSSANSALVHQSAGNTVDIPASAVKMQVGGGANPFTAMTTVSPFNAAASGLQIGPAISVTGANKNSSRTDSLAFRIDTTVVPQLPADAYSGTLFIQAQATP